MRKFPHLIGLTCICLLSGVPFANAQSNVKETQEKIRKWVETRQNIAEVREEWNQDKAILDEEVNLLEQQVAALEAEIETLETTQTQDDGRLGELVEEQKQLNDARLDLEESLVGLEAKVRQVVARLPETLTEERALKALTSQIPEDSLETEFTTSNRLVAILGVLTQADRFNDTTRIVQELRSFDGADRVSVRTLFWGLSYAFTVDATGTRASFGYPPEGGGEWVFEDISESAEDVRLLLDIAEGNTDEVQFVKLPLRLN
ncbi:MAG: DUF3450 family protein [Opitutales bacterium]